MADPKQCNADQLAFWNGPGGALWVARQEHTDIALAPVSEALLALAAPRAARAGAGPPRATGGAREGVADRPHGPDRGGSDRRGDRDIARDD